MSQPLSIKLSTTSVKTAMPEIADKTWCRVKLTEVKDDNLVDDGQEAGEKKPTITFRFELTQPALSKDGKSVEPGKPGSFLFERVYLRDKNNQTSVPERAIQQIARIQDALDNTGDEGNDKGLPARAEFGPAWVAASVGREAMAFVIIDGEYGNKIKDIKSTQDPKFAA